VAEVDKARQLEEIRSHLTAEREDAEPRTASFGLGEAAEAIRERVGLGARYSSFVPPRVRDAPRPRRRRWSRVLWAALLLNILVILVLAVLVGLGL
jgi:hypothetical protein